jgi:hypothetical protein
MRCPNAQQQLASRGPHWGVFVNDAAQQAWQEHTHFNQQMMLQAYVRA